MKKMIDIRFLFENDDFAEVVVVDALEKYGYIVSSICDPDKKHILELKALPHVKNEDGFASATSHLSAVAENLHNFMEGFAKDLTQELEDLKQDNADLMNKITQLLEKDLPKV